MLQAATLTPMGVGQEGDDWGRVAAAVRSRRQELDLSQRAAAELAKVAHRTWVEVEAGLGPKRGLTYGRMSRLLWGAEHSLAIERIASGGRPPRVQHDPERGTMDPVEAVRQARDIPDDSKGTIIDLIEFFRARRNL